MSKPIKIDYRSLSSKEILSMTHAQLEETVEHIGKSLDSDDSGLHFAGSEAYFNLKEKLEKTEKEIEKKQRAGSPEPTLEERISFAVSKPIAIQIEKPVGIYYRR